MTADNSSGANFAPVADITAPAAPAETHAGSFGNTRGSGLARGKRSTSASAPTAETPTGDYKPTSVAIITAQREYKNPFASPEVESAPAAQAAVPVTPAPVAAPVAHVFAEPQPAPAAAEPAAAEPIAAEPIAAPAEAPVEHKEIHILPPAAAERPAVSWESSSGAPVHRESPRGERPTFRPDRREDAQPGAPRPEERASGREPFNRDRQPRDPRQARQPRDPRDARQPRDPREARQPRDPRDEVQERFPVRPAAPEKKGFLGWLKGLFGGSKPATEAAAPIRDASPGEAYGDGRRPRRRHRGGRGHGGGGGQGGGFRNDRFQQGGDRPQGGEFENRGGDRGGRGRRHRGGPRRDRGEPRSEGQQGGGAI